MPLPSEAFIESASLIFILLNPFLLAVYLLDLIRGLDVRAFGRVLLRACAISTAVFVVFAWTGDAVFREVFQVRFAAFLIFGGVTFLLIGLRFVFQGPRALEGMRGEAEHLAGSIAMPFMIGPGTVSASVLAGAKDSMLGSALAIVFAVALCALCMMGLKHLHDAVRHDHEALVHRYVDTVGRASGLIVGTIAIEMLLRGVELWLDLGSLVNQGPLVPG